MKKRLLSLVLVVLLVVLSACSSGGNDVSRAYDEALNAMKQGKYAEAVNKLARISFYQDSTQLSLYCRAHAKAAEGDYDYAIEELEKLGSYRDAAQSAAYFAARREEDTAEDPYSRAYAAWMYDQETINGFRDSMARAASIRTTLYEEGLKAQEGEIWADAAERFRALGNYQDSETRYHYTSGRMYEVDGERAGISYGYAAVHYNYVPDYLDSAERKELCVAAAYQKADQLIDAADKAADLITATADLDEAEGIYQALGSLCDKDKLTKLDEARTRAMEAERQRLIAKADALVAEKQFDEGKELYLQAEEPQMANEALYLKAEYLAGEGKPEEAATQYREIFGYKDSREKHYLLGSDLKENDPETASRILLNDRDYPGVEDDLYEMALKATEAGNYSFSISIYGALAGKRDCSLRMLNDLYLYGQQLMQEENPEKAASVFDQLKGVGSADLYANMARYAAAEALQKNGSYEAAAKAFDLIAGYADAADRADKARYAAADMLEKNGSYEAAAKAFDLMAGYADATDRADNCRYQLAAEKKKNGQYMEAARIFAALGDREDSAEQEKDCRYLQAGVYTDRQLWEDAIELYEALNGYAESKARRAECYRQLGLQQLADGVPERAYRSFVSAGDTDGQAKAAFAVGEVKTANLEINEALKWYSLSSELPETEERTVMIAQSLLNIEEDALSEQYASVVSNSEKAQNVLYALALRSLERKDKEAAMRQMKKAGDYADASERFKTMLNERVEILISEKRYDDAIYLCSTYGEQEYAEEKVYKAKAEEAEQLLKDGKYDEAAALYKEIGETELAAKALAEKEEVEKKVREERYLAGKALLDTDPEGAFRILSEDLTYADVKTILYELADRESKVENFRLSYEIFESLAGLPLDPGNPMPDCRMRGEQDMYLYGLQLQDRKEWEAAASVFDQLSDFSNAQMHALQCRYAAAEALEEEEKYAQAAAAFGELGTYSDAQDRVWKIRYIMAEMLEEEEKYAQAAAAFEELGTYSDAQERVQKIQYIMAEMLEDEGKFAQAAAAFEELGAYSDAQKRAQRNRYSAAKKQMESGALESAATAFEKLGSYSNAAEMAKECRYQIACGEFESGAYAEAKNLFATLGDYSDSAEKKNECIYQTAERLMNQASYSKAIGVYETIVNYRDSAAKVVACRTKIAEQYIKKAESFLKDDKTDQAIESYLSAYLEYKKNEDKEHLESLTLRIAECYQFVNDLISARKWYKADGEEGKNRLIAIAEYSFLTEQYTAAEAVALETDTDAGKELLYRLAEHMLLAGDEEAALRLFEEAGDVRDAKHRHDDIIYQRAIKQIEKQDYLSAINLFDLILDHEDAKQKKQEAVFGLAVTWKLSGLEDPETKAVVQDAKLVFANDLIEKKEYEAAIEMLQQVEQTLEINEKINSVKYNLADTKEQAGDLEGALTVWLELGEYADAPARVIATRYHLALVLKETQEYDRAIELLKMIPDYEDAGEQITDCMYLKAGALTTAGDFGQALGVYQTILDYKDVKELMINTEGLKNELTLWRHSIKPGDRVAFGHVESGEMYTWIVLDRRDNLLCLVTEDIIGEAPFMEGLPSRTTWEHSTLRTYLNGEFLSSAFTEEEKKTIQLTKIKAEKSKDSNVSPGNNSEDYIFVMNQQDVEQYKEILEKEHAGMDWWLRSPGGATSRDNIIKIYNESTTTIQDCVSTEVSGIRPVIWVTDELFFELAKKSGKQDISAQNQKPIEEKTLLGVMVSELNETDVKNGWPCPGMLIVEVDENGPARKAGLQAGDVIIMMNDTLITTGEIMTHFLSKTKPGQIIKVRYRHATLFENMSESTYSFVYEDKSKVIILRLEE